MVCQAGPVLSGISTIFDGDSMIVPIFQVKELGSECGLPRNYEQISVRTETRT